MLSLSFILFGIVNIFIHKSDQLFCIDGTYRNYRWYVYFIKV